MSSSLRNGHVNGGANGHATTAPKSIRFSDVPPSIDVPVQDQEDEAVEIGLENLVDDPTDLCDLFENQTVNCSKNVYVNGLACYRPISAGSAPLSRLEKVKAGHSILSDASRLHTLTPIANVPACRCKWTIISNHAPKRGFEQCLDLDITMASLGAASASITEQWQGLLFAVQSAFLLYWASCIIYNIWFHPLSSFPGPWLARSTLVSPRTNGGAYKQR